MNAFKYASIYSFCLLAACTPMQKSDTLLPLNKMTGMSTQGAVAATNVTSWNLTGQFSHRDANESKSGTINWVQNGPNNYQIRFMGMMGAEAVVIEKNGNMYVYSDGKTRVTARSERELMRKMHKMQRMANAHAWYYWVRGLKAPGKITGAQYDANHRLMQFNQMGYTISYGPYTVVKGVALPTSVQVVGHSGVCKLAISSWKF